MSGITWRLPKKEKTPHCNINGQIISTASMKFSSGKSANIIIGNSEVGGREYFNGRIDDVRLYATALSADEMSSILLDTSTLRHHTNLKDSGKPLASAGTITETITSQPSRPLSSAGTRTDAVDSLPHGPLVTADTLTSTVSQPSGSSTPNGQGQEEEVVGIKELLRYEYVYDRNARKIEDRAYSLLADSASLQITRYGYDYLGRLVRIVYPDSDDPMDGSDDGLDGDYDRVEMHYDYNSNVEYIKDQRGVEFQYTYDVGNRMTKTDVILSNTSVAKGSVSREQFIYDKLNRVVFSANNFSMIKSTYDALSRLVQETQSIKLDGTGLIQVDTEHRYVSDNFEEPVHMNYTYDKDSNNLSYNVVHGTQTDLLIQKKFDVLNRIREINASYFDKALHRIATYSYIGPGRVQKKTLGNGATLTKTYDSKQRVMDYSWRDQSQKLLVGSQYGYDKMDNILYERFMHDVDPSRGPRTDWYQYNDRYEIIGVSYRTASTSPPVSYSSKFEYDDLYNRITSQRGVTYPTLSTKQDAYSYNAANEKIQLNRNGLAFDLSHDRNGNMSLIPVLPVTGYEDQKEVLAKASWDAMNCLFKIDTGINEVQQYRYDVLKRRVASMVMNGSRINGKRYIYDGWSVVAERVFTHNAKSHNAPSNLERVYVHGQSVDELLLTAMDRDGDTHLGQTYGKNQRDIDADQEYYLLGNQLGNVMAILDSDNADRVLEYYKYDVFGEAIVLPVNEGPRGRESTPTDLSDNLTFDPQSFSEEFGNVFLFAGRRFDDKTGLYYLRNRYYLSGIGQFISRDLLGYVDGFNLYQYGANSPATFSDPYGLVKAQITVEGVDDEDIYFTYAHATEYEWKKGRRIKPLSVPIFSGLKRGKMPKPDWSLGARIENKKIAPRGSKGKQFLGLTTVGHKDVKGVDNITGVRRAISNARLVNLWIPPSKSAKWGLQNGRPQADNTHCVQCVVLDAAIPVDTINKDLRGSVLAGVGSKALGQIPGGSLVAPSLGNKIKGLTSTSKKMEPRLILAICANGKNYAGAFNLPTPKYYNGILHNRKKLEVNASFRGAMTQIVNPIPGKASGPLPHINFWESP